MTLRGWAADSTAECDAGTEAERKMNAGNHASGEESRSSLTFEVVPEPSRNGSPSLGDLVSTQMDMDKGLDLMATPAQDRKLLESRNMLETSSQWGRTQKIQGKADPNAASVRFAQRKREKEASRVAELESQVELLRSELKAVSIPENVIKPWMLPPRKTYIFRNANVVDTVKGEIIANATIRISDGLIDSVTTSSSLAATLVAAGSGAVVVDLEGKYVSPGLIDSHVHLTVVPGTASLAGSLDSLDGAISLLRQPFVAEQTLRRGFTTVRDTGGATLALKEAIEDGVFPGPRLFISNHPLSQTGGHGDIRSMHDLSGTCCGSRPGLSVVCDGVPACVRECREQFRTGADFIKIMVSGGVASPADQLDNTQFTADEVRAICEVARSYGSYVTAHAYTSKAIRHAVDNGVRGIEHGNFVDEDTAKYMAEQGVWLTPTLITYEALAGEKYAGFLPPESARKNREVLSRGLQSLQIAQQAGVRICYGSDLLSMTAVEQTKEFAIRRRALGDVDILRQATVNPAAMLGQAGFLGQVEVGFAADLLVLTENPLEDVRVFDRPKECLLAVVKDGRVWDSRWSKLPTDVAEMGELIE